MNLMRFLGQPIVESLSTLQIAQTIVFSMIYGVGWAFVFAAALESRRALTSIGFGLIVAVIAFDYIDLYQAVPGDVLLVGIAVVNLIGWALVIAAALRGELNDAPSRKTTDL